VIRIDQLVIVFFLAGVTADAQVIMTKDEALRAAFPGMELERSTAFLSDVERSAIRDAAKARVESKVITYYVARKEGEFVGAAFFETMTVRTMPATIMVVIDPDTSVRMVELLAFYEPPDYRPSDRWLRQFAGTGPTSDLYLKRGIHAISGATLSAQAITESVRRLLATFTSVVVPRTTK
jgi:Na+-translocating ferredoxin:NAD+ oxidoreductase RnfG subunit